MADQQMRGTLDGEKGLVGGGGKTVVLPLAKDEGAREDCRDACGQFIVARGIDDEHVEVRVVLSAECLQTFLEPPTWVIGDHHGDDRRDLLLRHQGPNATADIEPDASESGSALARRRGADLGEVAMSAPGTLAIVSTRETKRSMR